MKVRLAISLDLKQFNMKYNNMKIAVFAVILSFVFLPSFAQDDPIAGDLRSVATGDWSNPATWDVYDGVGWGLATMAPDASTSVYLEEGDSIYVTSNVACKNLHLNNTVDVGRLFVDLDTLSITGKLRLYTGAAPGIDDKSTAGTINFINTGVTGALQFVGSESQEIIEPLEIGSKTSLVNFTVVINYDEGDTAIINQSMRCGFFHVNSGILQIHDAETVRPSGVRLVDENLVIDTDGDFIVKSGATVVGGKGFFQDNSSGFRNFILEEGSQFITQRTDVTIAAENVEMHGTYEFSKVGAQYFPSHGADGKVRTVGISDIDSFDIVKISGGDLRRLIYNTVIEKSFIHGHGASYIDLNGLTLAYGDSASLVYNSNLARITDDATFPELNGPTTLVIGNPAGVSLHDERSIEYLKLDSGNLYLDMHVDSVLGIVISEYSNSVLGNPSLGNMIVTTDSGGYVFKEFETTGGTFLYPIGDTINTEDYVPVTIALTPGATPITLGVKTIGKTASFNPNNNDLLDRTWLVADFGGEMNFDITCTYLDSDIIGDESNLVAYYFKWDDTMVEAVVDIDNNQFTFSGLDGSGQIIVTQLCETSNNSIAAPAVLNFCVLGADPAPITGLVPTVMSDTVLYKWYQRINNGAWALVDDQKDYDEGVILVAGAYDYMRLVTSGNCAVPDTSNVISITVEGDINHNVLVEPAQIIYCGPAYDITIDAGMPDGGSSLYNYEWMQSFNNEGFVLIDNEEDLFLDSLVNIGTYEFRRYVSSIECATESFSDTVAIGIGEPIVGNTLTALLETIFCLSDTNIVNVEGAEVILGSSFVYQWERDHGSGFEELGVATQNLSDSSITVAGQYRYLRRVVTESCVESSDTITVTFEPSLGNNTLMLTSDSENCMSANNVTINGTDPTGGDMSAYSYVWERNTGDGFAVLADQTTKSIIDPLVDVVGNVQYRRVVSSGSCMSDISDTVGLVIEDFVSNNIITQPDDSVFCGTMTGFALEGTTPINGNGTYDYDWIYSVDGGVYSAVSVDSIALIIEGEDSIGIYSVKRLVSSGVCTQVDTSNAVALYVQGLLTNNTVTAPEIEVVCGPLTTFVVLGSLPAGADTAAYVYAWRRYNVDSETWEMVGSSSDYNEMTLPSSGEYRYQRIINSGFCTADSSNIVSLAVDEAISANIIWINGDTIASYCDELTSNIPVLGSSPSGSTGNYIYNWEMKFESEPFESIGDEKNMIIPLISDSGSYIVRRSVFTVECPEPVPSREVTIQLVPITFDVDITPAHLGATGAIDLTMRDADIVYTFEWSTGAEVEDLENVPEGTYFVIIADEDGCEIEAELEVEIGLGVQDADFLKLLNIYPNPVEDELDILAEFNGIVSGKIIIVNTQGVLLYEEEINHMSSLNKRLDVSDYAAGVYLLRIESLDEVFNAKFMKAE